MNNLIIIAAVANNLEIGFENKLLWHISEDLKYFKKLTYGNTVVMGEKTWHSLPKKPLPNRRNVILSYNQNQYFEGAEVFSSIDSMLKTIKEDETTFIIGGASVYKQFIDIVSTLYITRVDSYFNADTYFPKIDENIWEKTIISEWKTDEISKLKYRFEKFLRIK